MQISRRLFLASAAGASVSGCLPSTTSGGELTGLVWGGSGLRNGQFQRPRAIAATIDEVYVGDTTGRIQVFTHEGKRLRGWRMPEFENGTPTGISFGRDGRVLIPDTHYSRIIEFSPSGEILAQWGGYGTGEDEFIYPTDIAQGADGTYYISEYGVGAERVHAFDADRRFAQQWGGHGNAPGQFSRAMAIALDDRAVYVCDTANHRVQVFTREGGFVRTIGEAGTGREQLNFPHDIAVAADGTIIVCEYGNNRLSRFTLEGRGVACAGGPGRAPGRFNTPRGVAVSPNGQVFVADTDNDRVQRFSLEDLA